MTESTKSNTERKDCFIYPKFLSKSNLSTISRFIYALLYNDALSSIKDGLCHIDSNGHVRSNYPIENLADDLFMKTEAEIKKALLELEKNKLIIYEKTVFGKPNNVYVKMVIKGKVKPEIPPLF